MKSALPKNNFGGLLHQLTRNQFDYSNNTLKNGLNLSDFKFIVKLIFISIVIVDCFLSLLTSLSV
jgi:hypothetical protein